MDVPNSNGTLHLEGIYVNGFNDVTGPLRFVLSGAKFGGLPESLIVNGVQVNASKMNITQPNVLVVDQSLDTGANTVYMQVRDSEGRDTQFETTFWAGDQNVTVRILDSSTEKLKNASGVVSLYLADSPHVREEKLAAEGEVLFYNLPDRTLVVEAFFQDGSYGSSGGITSDSVITVRVEGISPLSAVKNLEFMSLDGWEVETDSDSAEVVPHSESRRLAAFRNESTIGSIPHDESPLQHSFVESADQDNDLVLRTIDEGPQYIHHQFVVSPATRIRLRYRFQTDEIPGGYFGSEFNDYYAIAIRRKTGSEVFDIASETNSMNGLGLNAFSPGGYTEWRELVLQASGQESTIQVDAKVANVADEEYDSQVIIDYVAEEVDRVLPALNWDGDNGGLTLQYEILGATPLEENVLVSLFWAAGGVQLEEEAFATIEVVEGSQPGSYGPFNVPMNTLAPSDTTHIHAVSRALVFSLPDVKVMKGVNADFNKITPLMFDIIKGGLRNAGQPTATITSTTRSPEDQARAMFDNLVYPQRPIAENIQIQKSLYQAPGRDVIGVFESMVAGMSREDVIAIRFTVESAMVEKIFALGPSSVSQHCADPSTKCVVDVGAALLPNKMGQRFSSFVMDVIGAYSGGKYLDERNTNYCHHLELDVKDTPTVPSTPIACISHDNREGNCINRLQCLLQDKDPVPAISSNDPQPNCWNFNTDIQCCVEKNPNTELPVKCNTEAQDPLGSIFVEYLKLAEGWVGSYPYESLEGGNPTVGYGHKLTDAEVASDAYSSGITKEEAEELLIHDIGVRIPLATVKFDENHGPGAYNAAPGWGKRMLVDKVFQTGPGGLAQFKKMMNAINENDTTSAVAEMLTFYINKNGVKVFDYGRRDKFVKHALIECDEVSG